MSYFAVFDLKGGQTQIINQCKNGNITSKNITSHTFIHTCVIKHQLQRYLGVGGGESHNMTDDLPVDISRHKYNLEKNKHFSNETIGIGIT